MELGFVFFEYSLKIIRNYVAGVIKGGRGSAFGAKFEYVD